MQDIDYFFINDMLSDEHRLIRDSISGFVSKEILPEIENYAQESRFPSHLVKRFGDMGIFGPFIPQEYGGGGLDYIAYGLIMQELERGDSGMRSTASVQSSLVMHPINLFGSEEQKRKFLPGLASGDLLGSFGLTEPDYGSNPAGMVTRYTENGNTLILNGSKIWISNAPECDIAVVWAKDPNDRIRGLIVERGMKGFTTPETKGKWSLRASCTGELVFDNVEVPKENLLPNIEGLSGPLKCLDSDRYGISWGVLGAAMDCFNTAKKYAGERIQFDKPIAGFQLVQKKLAEMATEISKAQLMCYRLGQLMNENKSLSVQISIAKRNNVEMALNIARESRQILGAMGITGDFPIMRHMMNLESVITYEGTHDIHLLILGKDLTGIQAFK